MKFSFFTLLISIFILSCTPDSPQNIPGKLDSQANYVGDASCNECHAEENKNWATSHHAQSMMVATDSTVLGDFNNSVFKSENVTSTFFKKNNNFFVHTEGEGGVYDTFKIEYTFGITPLQQYLVKTKNGRMQALHTAWDVLKNKWFDLYPDQDLLPGDWLHWTKGGMNWNTMCAECHSTNLLKNYNSKTKSYNTTYDIINVSCESCHGPASIHVREAKAGLTGTQLTPMLLDTSTSSTEQVRACAPCHSRKTNLEPKLGFEGDYLNHHIPQILSDELYFADGQIQDEVYVYGSFIQSKMYHNNIKCTDCHEPHSLQLKKQGNDLCLQCHVPAYNTSSHSFHEEEGEGNKCINCHMTGRVYMGNDFRRDHSFRVPRPDQSVDFGTPNACMNCHQEKGDKWAAEKVKEWYGPVRAPHFSDALVRGRSRTPESAEVLGKLLTDHKQPAIARATAAFYLGDIITPESLEHLTKGLKDSSALVRHYSANAFFRFPKEYIVTENIFNLLADSVKAVRLAAANLLVGIYPDQLPEKYREAYRKASYENQKSLENQLDFPMGQFQMAQYYYRKNDLGFAAKYYEESTKMDTLLHIARENLARVYNSMGKNDEAIEQLNIILSLQPDHEQANYSLGLIYAENERDLAKSIAFLTRTTEINPLNERAHYNLALAYIHHKETAMAEQAYLKGIKMIDSSFILRQGLAILYIQNNNKEKALPLLSQLEKIRPGDPQLEQLRKSLQ